MAFGGIVAVSVGLSDVPPTRAVDRSAGPSNRAEIGWIDRRGFDANQHFVGRGLGNRGLLERQLKLAAGGDQGSKLQVGGVAH